MFAVTDANYTGCTCVVFGKGHVGYDADIRCSHSSAVQPHSIAIHRPSLGWFVVDGCVLRCSGSYCISDVLTVDLLFARSGFTCHLIDNFTGFNSFNM